MRFIGRPNTIRTKTSLYNKWIKPFRKKSLEKKVQIWQEHDLAPRTVRSLISIACEVDNIKPPSKLIKMILRSEQEKPILSLNRGEVIKFTQALEECPELKLPALISLHTGMRRGEVWGLRWDEVDLIEGTLTINNSYGGPTKNGKTRKIPISKELEKELLAYMPLKNYNKTKVVSSLFDPNPKLRFVCEKAGIKPITFHGLRHTFATLALEAGRTPKLVQQALGHTNVSTTLDIYWNTNEEKIELGFIPS